MRKRGFPSTRKLPSGAISNDAFSGIMSDGSVSPSFGDAAADAAQNAAAAESMALFICRVSASFFGVVALHRRRGHLGVAVAVEESGKIEGERL